MSDTLTPEQRRRCMSNVKGKNTGLELLIRKALFAKGFRYKLHDKSLPGKPDLVFPKYNAVIFIHGCFWHGHDCHLFKWPSTRQDFWKNKINRNMDVDVRNYRQLKDKGWWVLTIWGCAIKGKYNLGVQEVTDRAAYWLKYGMRDVVIKGRE
ncbi:MAG: DNA mismatch endonuclease Vsr [Gammaproteobacteria bacterium]|nr:DNA mismatch endonuclease Vsr [Gammaproteobacteria bacterium]